MKHWFNELANRVQTDGLRNSYHNHSFEFNTIVDGHDGLSYLIEHSSDNLILAELDVFWLKNGGHDPIEFLKPYAGRVPILHMKDMSDDEEQVYAEVGTGSIDFKSIVRWGKHLVLSGMS
ncbi:sugar phosphate isomerase/epimerase family protein [Paenibacillus sp. MY03]|jgi:sugar phosphate isomerase/epimerase|uniref:sugar phosphate isomerase/epimerase family protein n=1 Tax=Paenibacillus sp. MY03 TaxID=302980 RepID=UPI0026989B37